MTRSMNTAEAAADGSAAPPRGVVRPRLTLRDVVLAARAVLTEGGVDALTMSAVATRLGVTPMALYRHVDGRAALLAAVADSVLEEVGAAVDASVPWDDAVVMWMADVRHRIVESPWTAQLIGTPTQIAPAWAAALDRLLAVLERGPLDDDARADALVWIARTTVGVVLLEAKSPLARPGHAVGTALESALETASPEMARRWERIDARLTSYRDDDLFEDLVRQTRARLADAASARSCFGKRERPVSKTAAVDATAQAATQAATQAGADAQAPADLADLTDAQWRRIRTLLPLGDQRGAARADDRRVVDGIRHRERTGVPWRNVPAKYGSWQTLYGRHRRWADDGTWARVTQALDS
ncbi:transposase [Streptomycetaceae bacterium NBC_01309]